MRFQLKRISKMSSEIPPNSALSEASPESLQSLFSRDPEGYQQQDKSRVIAEMRALRERLVQVPRAGQSAPAQPPAVLDFDPDKIGC